MTVLETVVIPFNYIPINGGGWIRTAEPEGTVLQTVAFNQTSLLLHVVKLISNQSTFIIIPKLRPKCKPFLISDAKKHVCFAASRLQGRLDNENPAITLQPPYF